MSKKLLFTVITVVLRPCKNSTFSQHSFGNSGLSCTGIYSTTVKKDELGDLKLSNEKELDIVAFMKTQTDGFLTE